MQPSVKPINPPAPHSERYEIWRMLGAGGAGRVFEAYDRKLNRTVAIKYLSDTADHDMRRRFRIEARAIAALKHPNIIELYDYSGEDAQQLYVVMEMVPGSDLHRYLDHYGPMSETTALCIGHDVALAIEHAHASKIIHRDLKPENLLLHDGRVVLTDFGAVKAIARDNVLGIDGRGNHTRVIGTPGFMAPELFEGTGIDERADIFGFGATLYNFVTGQVPYVGDTIGKTYRNIKAGRYADPGKLQPLLSKEFCSFLHRCLASKPDKRFDDVPAMRAALQSILSEQGISEVREELRRYQRDPSGTPLSQRLRTVDALFSQLKIASQDNDRALAKRLAGRIRKLAPDDERLAELPDLLNAPPPCSGRHAPQLAARLRNMALSFAAGGIAGGASVAWLLLQRL